MLLNDSPEPQTNVLNYSPPVSHILMFLNGSPDSHADVTQRLMCDSFVCGPGGDAAARLGGNAKDP
jgi:hypothetical protein